MGEKVVQFCPICGSKNFGFYKSNKFMESIGNFERYKCARCKNIFPFPLEMPESEAHTVKEAPLNEELLHETPKEYFVGEGYAYFIIVFGFFIVSLIFLGLVFVFG